MQQITQVLTSSYQLLMRCEAHMQEWGGMLLSVFLRAFVGWQFFKAGLVKVQDWDATLALFKDEYKVPLLPTDLAAVMGAGGELVLPILLFAGFLTRPAALGLLGVNIMAVISYPQIFEFTCPAAVNDHFYWGVMLIAVTVFGPGRLSVDAWLAARLRAN